MIRALGGLTLAVVGVWVIAHLLYIGPLRAALETTRVWVVGFAAGSLVAAALVLLAVGLMLGESRPAWFKFVRVARSAGAVTWSAARPAACPTAGAGSRWPSAGCCSPRSRSWCSR
jgi:hypothetical protein